jgi:PAS domain S-box-containing protein
VPIIAFGMSRTAAFAHAFSAEHTFPVGSNGLTAATLAGLFDTLPIAVVLCDSETREILAANASAVELYGYAEEEIVGATPPFPWWPDGFEIPAGAWLTETPTSHDSLLRRKDGTLVPVEIRACRLRSGRRARDCTVATITDVSERRRFEQQVLQAGKLAAIGELAAGVAHEINNPLFGILGLVEFLLRDVEPGSRSEDRLLLVQQTGLEIKEIVRSLLDFARESADEQRLVALRDVWAEATELVRRASSAKGVELVERYDRDRTDVLGNPNQLKQIALNLLSNAQQAMPGGGTATIEVVSAGDTVRARIVDTGPGIPADVLPRILEPFFTSRRDLGGTGLGLAVCHGIAKAHGGELTAANVPGAGACFELCLPAYDPDRGS